MAFTRHARTEPAVDLVNNAKRLVVLVLECRQDVAQEGDRVDHNALVDVSRGADLAAHRRLGQLVHKLRGSGARSTLCMRQRRSRVPKTAPP